MRERLEVGWSTNKDRLIFRDGNVGGHLEESSNIGHPVVLNRREIQHRTHVLLNFIWPIYIVHEAIFKRPLAFT